MRCYLELNPKTPLDFLHREFFPDGFPAKQQCTGMPERFKRSDGGIFWKLDLSQMEQLQRRAVLNYYHHTIRTQRTDWAPLLNMVPEILEEANLTNGLSSVLSAEPPKPAIVFIEGAPSIADYCVSQSFWGLWLRKYLVQRMQAEMVLIERKQEQQRQLAEASQQPLMVPDFATLQQQKNGTTWNEFYPTPPY